MRSRNWCHGVSVIDWFQIAGMTLHITAKSRTRERKAGETRILRCSSKTFAAVGSLSELEPWTFAIPGQLLMSCSCKWAWHLTQVHTQLHAFHDSPATNPIGLSQGGLSLDISILIQRSCHVKRSSAVKLRCNEFHLKAFSWTKSSKILCRHTRAHSHLPKKKEKMFLLNEPDTKRNFQFYEVFHDMTAPATGHLIKFLMFPSGNNAQQH